MRAVTSLLYPNKGADFQNILRASRAVEVRP
jgi:hypothetical protein